MYKYDLAIFDLDGTILNTLDDLAQAVNHALTTFNLQARSTKEVADFTGNGIRSLIELSCPKDTSSDLVDKVFDEFKKYYSLHSSDNTCPYPQILETVKRIKDLGIHVAVLSNKTDAFVQDLAQKFFGDTFEICRGEIAGVARKPSPDAVFNIISELNCSPQRTVYIGDSEVDIKTSINANVDCIAVTWGFRDKEFLSKFDYPIIVDTADQLFCTITRKSV